MNGFFRGGSPTATGISSRAPGACLPASLVRQMCQFVVKRRDLRTDLFDFVSPSGYEGLVPTESQAMVHLFPFLGIVWAQSFWHGQCSPQCFKFTRTLPASSVASQLCDCQIVTWPGPAKWRGQTQERNHSPELRYDAKRLEPGTGPWEICSSGGSSAMRGCSLKWLQSSIHSIRFLLLGLLSVPIRYSWITWHPFKGFR